MSRPDLERILRGCNTVLSYYDYVRASPQKSRTKPLFPPAVPIQSDAPKNVKEGVDAAGEKATFQKDMPPAWQVDISAEGCQRYEKATFLLTAGSPAPSYPDDASRELSENTAEASMQALNATSEKRTISFNSDYDELGSPILTIEGNIELGLAYGKNNKGAFTITMIELTRGLNAYVAQRPKGETGYDDYLTSLTDRFDKLDPDHKNALLNHMRKLIDRAARGLITHIDDEDFIFGVETAFDENQKRLPYLTETKLANTSPKDGQGASALSLQEAKQEADLTQDLLASLQDVKKPQEKESASRAASNPSDGEHTRTQDRLITTSMGEPQEEEAVPAPAAQEPEDTAQKEPNITSSDWVRESRKYAEDHPDIRIESPSYFRDLSYNLM